MPNLTWISKKYFPDLYPRLINSGNCYNWAYIAYQNYNNVKLFTIDDYGGHAFVKIGQKYFDAQNPRGVGHWAFLDLIQEMSRGRIANISPRRQSLDVFLNFWKKYGKHPLVNIKVDNVRNRSYG